jgi:hypothetical protein
VSCGSRQSYEEADAAAAELARLFGAYVPAKCRTVALQLICLGSFPVCQIGTTLSRTSPLHLLRRARPTSERSIHWAVTTPCRSVCENMWLECLPLLQSLNITYLMPDCDAVQVVDGVSYPAFPPDGISCFPYVSTTGTPHQ